MNNRKFYQSHLFAAQPHAFSLVDLIGNMNKQYVNFKIRSGGDPASNWTIEKNPGNIETPHAHYQIYFGNFYRTELWNFLAEQNLQPVMKTEGDRHFLIVTESSLKEAKTTSVDAGHFLFSMHIKIDEMLDQTISASPNCCK